jgi:hypothetical protein
MISFFLQKTEAATEYLPLVTDLEDFSKTILTGSKKVIPTTLEGLINFSFYALLAVAVVLAIFGVIRGGYVYLTSGDNANNKGRAKRILQASVGGLLLALGGWLILKTINPEILKFNPQYKRLDTAKVVTVEIGAPSTVTYGGQLYRYDPDTNMMYDKDGKAIAFEAGQTVVPSSVRIDTDGKTPPPFNDPHYQNQTSLSGLDANYDYYVVVPIGSNVKLGTQVQLYNQDTGKSITAIVGDRGPTANGLGEMSLAAARALGSWEEGMGNSAHSNHKIEWTFSK